MAGRVIINLYRGNLGKLTFTLVSNNLVKNHPRRKAMKRLVILLSMFILMMATSVQAAAPPLAGTTWKGTGYLVDPSTYITMSITLAIKSQKDYRFRGTATTKVGTNLPQTQQFAAVIATTNQIYMVIKSTSSQAADVIVDAKYNPTANTITGYFRTIDSTIAGYFTLKKP